MDYDALASQFGGQDPNALPLLKNLAADAKQLQPDQPTFTLQGKQYNIADIEKQGQPPADYDALAKQFGGQDAGTQNAAVADTSPYMVPFIAMGRSADKAAAALEQATLGAGSTVSKALGANQFAGTLDSRLAKLKQQQAEADQAYAPLAQAHPGLTLEGELPGMMLGRTPLGMAGIAAASTYGSPEERAKAGGMTYAGGKVGQYVGNALITAVKTPTSLLSPLFNGGQEKMAGRALEQFAARPESVLAAKSSELVPGSLPTLAEATGDPGIAQLQRTLANTPQVGNALTQRAQQNIAARMSALQGIAGDEGQRAFYDASRSTAAQELYNKAFENSVLVDTTPWVKGQITQLQKRPAFQDAWQQGIELARNEGLPMNKTSLVQTSHYAKMALDDKISSAMRAGDNNEARVLVGLRDKLVTLMESEHFSPFYGEARRTYAAMSQPINQMDIGQSLLDTYRPALGDFGATMRGHAAQYANAVRNADATAQRALGFPGAKMENVLTPAQMATVRSVASDLGRAANAQEVGKAVGSNTMQNLVGQDVLNQALGSSGLPPSLLAGPLGNLMSYPANWLYKPFGVSDKTFGLLGNAMLSPEEAARLLAKARRDGRFSRPAADALNYAGSISGGLLGLQAGR